MSNTTTMIRTLATTITFIILTAVIITPSTALALNGNNKNIDLDGANVKTLVMKIRLLLRMTISLPV